MNRRYWIALLIGGTLIVGSVALPAVYQEHWTGHTNLEVRFVVTNVETGLPIRQAQIRILEVEELGERESEDFTLSASSDGVTQKMCFNVMTSGVTTYGPLGQDTFNVRMPLWYFTAQAPGYMPSDTMELNATEFRHTVRRVGPGQAEVVVPISLQSYK